MKSIDLFAGIGGIRKGFSSVSECVFSSEWDKFACKTYEANFGDIPSGDITKVDVKDIPSFDILTAGFPCQPFSQAGKKLGFNDTRGTLFHEIVRIAKHHKPKVIFLENVKNLVNHDSGKTLKVIIKAIEELGYTVRYKVYNAKNFGVPQNRERIYIIGILGNKSFEMPKEPNITSKLKDVLEPFVSKKYAISAKAWSGHLLRKEKHISKGNGFGYSLFTGEEQYANTLSARYYKDGSEILINQKYYYDKLGSEIKDKYVMHQWRRSYLRDNKSGLCPTLTANMGTGGNNVPLFRDNVGVRRLTPRECARLQGFPESFVIPVSDSQAYKQFGNSVAIPVVKFLAEYIKKTLDNI